MAALHVGPEEGGDGGDAAGEVGRVLHEGAVEAVDCRGGGGDGGDGGGGGGAVREKEEDLGGSFGVALGGGGRRLWGWPYFRLPFKRPLPYLELTFPRQSQLVGWVWIWGTGHFRWRW